MAKFLHVVWAPITVDGQLFILMLGGYWNLDLAHAHARTMIGVDVASVEVLERLPTAVQDDIESDYAEEDADMTPVDGVVILINDIDEEKVGSPHAVAPEQRPRDDQQAQVRGPRGGRGEDDDAG